MTLAAADPVVPPAGTPVAAAAPTSPAAPVAAATPAAAPVAAPAADAKPTRLLGEDPAKAAEPVKVEAKAEAPKPADWSLKAPEGQTWDESTAATAKEVEAFAKAEGLTQAQAEKFLARESAAAEARTVAQTKDIEAVGQTWLKQAQEHPEIGGKNLDGAVANAKRALAAWATPEERKAIADSPFANNPLFLAILNRAAKALPAEDTIHAGGAHGAPRGPINPAEIMYGHLNKK